MAERRYIRANSVHRALNIIGDGWTLLILRDAFLGVRRFDDWRRHLGIPRQRLADRLRKLVRHEVLRKAPYGDKPVRYEYRLTARGRDLYPFALMIRRWEDRWLSDGRHPWVWLIHSICGRRFDPRCVCGQCGLEVSARDTGYEQGPGAGREAAVPPRFQRRSTASGPEGGQRMFMEQAIEILGDRWTYLVVGGAFLGLRRFDALRRELAIATNILTDRLRRLVEAGLLRRLPSAERAGFYDYVLTAKGRDFFPVVVALTRWGDRWLAGDNGIPLTLFHRPCGHRLVPRFVCDQCGGDLRAHEVGYQLTDGRLYPTNGTKSEPAQRSSINPGRSNQWDDSTEKLQ
jgi:DNA-binding HxlR family transcriptional regulator